MGFTHNILFEDPNLDQDTPIHLEEVRCTGSENNLLECGHNGIGIHDCAHGEDVGIICERKHGIANYNTEFILGLGLWSSLMHD